MNKKQQRLAIGCLLHDFGKLLYRFNDRRNHSLSGYEFIGEIDGLGDESEILNCIHYHHTKLLKDAQLEKDDIAYIAFIADNIASAADRRVKSGIDSGEGGFVREASLETIFNVINGNNEKKVYKPYVSELSQGINHPTDAAISYSEEFYSGIINNIKNLLGQLYFGDEYVNSLLQVLETNLAFVPSSTNMEEVRDISLYDHLKLTAAFALCIEQYLEEQGIRDYKVVLFENAEVFYEKKAFRIYSIDLSGIQSFIYNITSKGALKSLRARSFYLEMLMESSVDELLKRTALCRANVLYTGGGHAYIILPATEKIRQSIELFEKELNDWFIKYFGADLFAAGGFSDCSAMELQNKPDGKYKEIFTGITKSISAKKMNRYSASDIIRMNKMNQEKHTRECRICHRSDRLDNEDKCSLCSSLEKLSGMIIAKDDCFYVITKGEAYSDSIIMPFGYSFSVCNKDEIVEVMKQESYVRAYTKNVPYTGKELASNLWVGDYASAKTFEDLAAESTGIKRLGVIRADVDNLGKAFVNGFSGRYETLTRTSVFSRKLSMFFKYHINGILKNGTFQLVNGKDGKRQAVIVYAGGDDLFIVGAWDSIICFSIDLYNNLKQYSQGQMTVSAGIGIYPCKYPIAAMAQETGRLETISKEYDGGTKNAITLFGADYDKNRKYDNTYHWDELIEEVIGEKLETLKAYFGKTEKHNNAMMYKMLQLIRNRKEENKLNIARFTYLLARLRPDKEKEEETSKYNDFAKKMYRWIRNDRDCKQLVTAIQLYVYLNRDAKEDGNE